MSAEVDGAPGPRLLLPLKPVFSRESLPHHNPSPLGELGGGHGPLRKASWGLGPEPEEVLPPAQLGLKWPEKRNVGCPLSPKAGRSGPQTLGSPLGTTGAAFRDSRPAASLSKVSLQDGNPPTPPPPASSLPSRRHHSG